MCVRPLVAVDVRSLYYYENWGIRGAEWVQNFDLRRLYDGSIRKVAFYCWIAPWESEPASLWFDANFGHLGIETYDMKGLTYLDDIPGFCPFINGTPELIEQMGPQCANAQPHTCPAETAAPVALTEEQVAAAAAAPVSVDTPSLSELPMTAEAFREGIANALSEYYGQPVDIDLSNLPTADPAHSVSLTDETITPLVSAVQWEGGWIWQRVWTRSVWEGGWWCSSGERVGGRRAIQRCMQPVLHILEPE